MATKRAATDSPLNAEEPKAPKRGYYRPPSKMQLSVKPHISNILGGTVLAVDPSSGSRESMPGYAIFKAGELVDSGFIALEHNDDLHKRLFNLGRCLRDQFAAPDILVTENIPPVMTGKGFFNRSMVSLQRAIGVVISSYNCPLIEVAPITWRQNIPDDYRKTDEADALMMSWTVLKAAREIAGLPPVEMPERLRKKLQTGEWDK
jgi:hypothetical protein